MLCDATSCAVVCHVLTPYGAGCQPKHSESVSRVNAVWCRMRTRWHRGFSWTRSRIKYVHSRRPSSRSQMQLSRRDQRRRIKLLRYGDHTCPPITYNVDDIYVSIDRYLDIRAAPLVRVKTKSPVENAVCCRRRLLAYGVFDCDFRFDSHEWSCSPC